MDELKEDEMMPLTMANGGETNVIKKIGGKEMTPNIDALIVTKSFQKMNL